MADKKGTQVGASADGDLVSQVKLDDKRAHSKTMRLDILPNAGESAPPVSAVSRTVPADKNELTLTPEMLGHLYQNAYDATLITDLQGEILSGNIRASEYLVGKYEPIIGRNMLDIISGVDAALLERLETTLDTERFVRIHAWCKRSSGEFFPAEVAVHLSVMDSVKHLCFFMHDITWRKEAEDRLQMVDVAFCTTHAGIAVINMDGMLIFANPALHKLLGRPSVKGLNISHFLADPEVPQALLKAILDGHPWHGRTECVLEDGIRLMVECDAVGNSNSDGDLIGAVLSFNDMTDHIRAADAERNIERNRVMMESIGSVCHHLGQPSTVLLNCIELLQRLDDDDQAQRRELLDISLAAAESLGGLLRELNDLRTYRSEPYLAQSQPRGDQIISMDEALSRARADLDVIN
jgi:PAS domain S-box-containing protein